MENWGSTSDLTNFEANPCSRFGEEVEKVKNFTTSSTDTG